MTCAVPSARRHRDAVGVVLAAHELVVGGVHRVGPGAGRIDRELAVAVPPVPVCATKVAGLSTSVMVSVPPVLMRPPRWSRSGSPCRPAITAASLVPWMVTVTELCGAVGASPP